MRGDEMTATQRSRIENAIRLLEEIGQADGVPVAALRVVINILRGVLNSDGQPARTQEIVR
jgi:hypothetical protein